MNGCKSKDSLKDCFENVNMKKWICWASDSEQNDSDQISRMHRLVCSCIVIIQVSMHAKADNSWPDSETPYFPGGPIVAPRLNADWEAIWTTCTDPESFIRGGSTFSKFMRGKRIQIAIKAGHYRPASETPCIAKKPYIFVIFQGGPEPLSPPRSPPSGSAHELAKKCRGCSCHCSISQVTRKHIFEQMRSSK